MQENALVLPVSRVGDFIKRVHFLFLAVLRAHGEHFLSETDLQFVFVPSLKKSAFDEHFAAVGFRWAGVEGAGLVQFGDAECLFRGKKIHNFY